MTPSPLTWPGSTCFPGRSIHSADWPSGIGFAMVARSQRDGIAVLDAALLDAEIALLTAAAEDFFTDDTFDSDVAEILRPHAAALDAHVRQGDPRVLELVRECTDLADDVGIVFEATVEAARRDDYALAAGGDIGKAAAAMNSAGVGSVEWSAVLPVSSTQPRTPSTGASKPSTKQ